MTGQMLLDLYESLERRYVPETDPNYERLVVASDSCEEPVHRWFRMKEAFSPHLLPRVLKDLHLEGRDNLRLLDPFSGSGTTLTSGLTWAGEEDRSVRALAFEVNPFLHLLSSAKIGALLPPDSERLEISRRLEAAAVNALAYTGPGDYVPELATFSDARYFKGLHLKDLLTLRASLDQLPDSGPRELLMVALAAAVEPSSNLRRDGRALRYVPNRTAIDPRLAFARKCKQIANDVRTVASEGSALVLRQDGRLMSGAASNSFDLAVFSPPYPNNIDYTEVYKLESWLLRLTLDQKEFRAQREATMRSHPSISWSLRQTPNTVPLNLESIIDPILEALPDDRYKNDRRQVFTGYLEDAALILSNLARVLRNGGHAVCVVGNSRHGGEDGITFAADLLIAQLAEMVGLSVDAIRVARQLRRRGREKLLRESVLLLSKPL